MLPISEACERNRDPILAVLKVALARSSRVMEIGSGTGQHAVYFSRHLPHLVWQPTELPVNLAGLAARVSAEGGTNLCAPHALDVRQPRWPLDAVDAVFTANTLHIMSWAGVTAAFKGIGSILAPGGVLCVYGPLCYGGQYTSESNRRFDQMLRERDPDSGLRDIQSVAELAEAAGLALAQDHDLPANNRLLVFCREIHDQL